MNSALISSVKDVCIHN